MCPSYKDLCDYHGPTWRIQILNLVTSARSPLPYEVMCPQVLGMRTGTALGGFYSVYPIPQ